MCPHQPLCPSATSPDHSAAHTLAAHPDQGWSLLCNGVIVFDDFGELLPDGRAVAPLATPRPITLAAGDRGRAGHESDPDPPHDPATARVVALVGALPGELDARPAITIRVAAVEFSRHRNEAQFAETVLIELDEAGPDQVDGLLRHRKVGSTERNSWDTRPSGES